MHGSLLESASPVQSIRKHNNPTTLHALLARTCFFSRYRKNSLLTFANSRRFLRYRRIDTVIHPLFVDRASRKPVKDAGY